MSLSLSIFLSLPCCLLLPLRLIILHCLNKQSFCFKLPHSVCIFLFLSIVASCLCRLCLSISLSVSNCHPLSLYLYLAFTLFYVYSTSLCLLILFLAVLLLRLSLFLFEDIPSIIVEIVVKSVSRSKRNVPNCVTTVLSKPLIALKVQKLVCLGGTAIEKSLVHLSREYYIETL